MGGRGSNSTDRLLNGGRKPKSEGTDKQKTIAAQINDMAKKGQMPKAIMGGSKQDQVKAFEAINKAYKYSDAQKTYLNSLKVTDQPSHNRLYIRKPDGGVSVQTYPKGASQSAKDGALKMFVYNTAPKSGSATKWSRTTIKVKGQDTPAHSSGGRYAVYKDGGDRYRVYDTKTGITVTQGHGADLTFNKLKDAKQYAMRK